MRLYFYVFTYAACGSFFFCKQKTAYDVRISDWSSDVCSSDLFLSIDEKGGRSAHADSARIRDVLLHPCHRLGGGHGTRLRDIKPRLFGSSPCRVHLAVMPVGLGFEQIGRAHV